MIKAQDELHHEALLSRAQVATQLRASADGIESGRLRLSSGAEQLVSSPPDLCSFERRARSATARSCNVRLVRRTSDAAKDVRSLKIES